MLVQILLAGGMDSILTTDPKQRRDVEKNVDLPYPEAGIKKVGQALIGPLFTQVERYVPQMAILNGIDGSTVSHFTGELQTQQMRRVFPASGAYTLAGTIGALRMGDAPLAEVQFISQQLYTPPPGRCLVVNFKEDTKSTYGLLYRLSQLARHEVRGPVVAQVLDAERKRCGLSRGCMPLEAVLALLRKMAEVDLPDTKTIPIDIPKTATATEVKFFKESQEQWSLIWRDVLYLLRHHLAATVFIRAPGSDWDSHAWNEKRQNKSMDVFGPALLYFLDELQRQHTSEGRRLCDEVAIVISSELGRFPIKNEYDGKDHFPEFPAILLGPGLRPGQYGQTDRNMVSTPIGLQTGHSGPQAKNILPTLDDLGATILHWFAIEDAASVGHLGSRLDFLLA